MANIRVLLADDDSRCLHSVRAYLHLHGGLDVVASARDGQEAAGLYAQLHPDVVVMDLSMPECDGIEGARLIHAHDPHARIVVLSAHDAPESRARCSEAGVWSFVAKHEVTELLVPEIRRAASGEPA